MTIQEVVKKKGNLPKVPCSICRADTFRQPSIMKLGYEYGLVCGQCAKHFSLEEIELMHNMFTAFGGHFGLLKQGKSSKYKVITKLIDEFGMPNGNAKPSELDVKILHKALLFGITPRQLLQGIRLLND